MRMTVPVALILLTLVTAAHAGPDVIRPWGGHLPGGVTGSHVVVQVLDAVTGEPVEGVDVRAYDEDATIGFLRAALLARTATDEFGLADLPWKERPRDAHWVFDAPGYAVMEKYGSFPPERVWLLPGGEIRARLLDPFGRPAAGAEVELFLGCGHSPAVRLTRTSAEGWFRFRDVRPDRGQLWFRMAGAYAEYADVPANGKMVTTLPGLTVAGVVTDREGQPAPGVLVASTQFHRGPATKTDADGRFRLHGVDPDEGIQIFAESYLDGEKPFVFLDEYTLLSEPDRPCFLRLTVPPSEVDPDDYLDFVAPGAAPLPVRVTDAVTGADLPDVPVLLVSEKTGLGYSDDVETDEEDDPTGRRVILARPGPYRFTPGGPFDRYRVVAPARHIDDRAWANPTIELKAVEQPVLRLTGVTPAMKHADIHLILPRAWWPLSPGDEDPLYLPAGEKALVRVTLSGTVRYFPVGPVKDGVRAAKIEWDPVEEDPPEEEDAAPRPGIGPIRLVDAAGKPIVGLKFRTQRRNRGSWGTTTDEGRLGTRGQSATSDGGYVSLPEKFIGPPFILELEGWVTRMIRAEESGELTIRYPAGVIDLTVTAEGGEVGYFGYAVDGMTARGTGGKLTIRGVEPGRRKVVVGAAGYGSVICIVDVPAAGVKKLTVTLR